MTPEQKALAGRAVTIRMAQLGLSVPELARLAGVSPSTVRALKSGTRWPTYKNRAKILKVLGWPEGELGRRATEGDTRLHQFSSMELLNEVCRRLEVTSFED